MFKRFFATVAMAATVCTGTLAVAAPAASAAETTTDCPSGHWPSDANGKPASAVAGMTGAAVWRDRHGWHLRVSEEGTDRATFTGYVTTDGHVASVERHTEGGDIGTSIGRKTVWFRFSNYGGVDGLDFAVRCASYLKIKVSMNGAPLSTEQIAVGAADTHPASNPFTIHKVA